MLSRDLRRPGRFPAIYSKWNRSCSDGSSACSVRAASVLQCHGRDPWRHLWGGFHLQTGIRKAKKG